MLFTSIMLWRELTRGLFIGSISWWDNFGGWLFLTRQRQTQNRHKHDFFNSTHFNLDLQSRIIN